jgi:putative NADH-flavin reductase
MRLALIGATGYVGSRVLAEALTRGHQVTAIVRDISRLPSRDRLTARAADVQEPTEVAVAVADHDAVVSCFHPGGHDPGAEPHLYRDIVEGTHAIIAGTRAADVSRILYIGGCGSLYAPSGLMLVDDREALLAGVRAGRPEGTYPTPAPGGPSLDIPRGARIAYYLFERETDLAWTFLSPSRYIGDFGGPSGRLRVGGEDLLFDPDGSPSRIDVADLAIAAVDEIEDPQHVRGHFTVATAPAAT